jgi:glycerol-3-phosphate O-acyltransferase
VATAWTQSSEPGARRTSARGTARRAPYVLSGDDVRSVVLRRVVDGVLTRADSGRGPRLYEIVSETLYAEQQRLAHGEPDPRSSADREFISRVRRALLTGEQHRELVYEIVDRYTREIAGHFDPRVYGLATRVVPAGLSALLHGFTLHHPRAFDIEDRIVIEGQVGALRALAQIGTVILAPTHVSNLDSLVLGSAIHTLGLPPFAYGAGLNLFSNALIGFFMKNLGAYTIDRRKTDPLYRTTLKAYATILLERGQHSLFFPGGTRSRSGGIETHVKKGLLGTAPIAFRHALEGGARNPRVFVVPCTLTYPIVLEASTLVGDYLRAEGGPHYVDVRDEFDRPHRWLDFLRSLRQLDQRVYMRIGQALDWLGNEVDERGTSRDPAGRPVDPARYLMRGGALVEDDARDAEYTRLLASRLAASYRRENVALPSQVLAFVLFERLRRELDQPNLFHFLRSLGPERGVAISAVVSDVAQALSNLATIAKSGDIRPSPELRDADAGRVLDDGLATLTTYHAVPVLERRGDEIHVTDPGLLFYYRNRLDACGLLGTAPVLPSGGCRPGGLPA